MTTAPIFDATLLTREEVIDVARAIQSLDDLMHITTDILLAPIPVIGDGGTDIIGHLYHDDALQWRFTPGLAPELSLLPPPRKYHPDHNPDFEPEDAA